MKEALALMGATEIRVYAANGRAKQIWSENRIGRALRLLGREVKIPLVTGRYGFVRKGPNLVVTAGHAAAAARLTGQGSYNAFSAVAIGLGTTAAGASDTSLGSEITTGGGARTNATLSLTTTTVTNDTAQLVASWTFSGSFAVTEAGIFDSTTLGGSNLFARQVFSAVNVASTDVLSITWKVTA